VIRAAPTRECEGRIVRGYTKRHAFPHDRRLKRKMRATAFDREPHQRRSVRLPNYDYSQAGAYFVTVCAHNRRCLFGRLAGEHVMLSRIGGILAEEWKRSSDIRQEIRLDEWVVMPNHLHGIVIIRDCGDGVAADVGAHGRAPLEREARSLSSFIAGFKAATTKRMNDMRETPGARLWQRNYYERVIRSQDELRKFRKYILDNPTQWALDRENPDRDTGAVQAGRRVTQRDAHMEDVEGILYRPQR
jgi:putative transposase